MQDSKPEFDAFADNYDHALNQGLKLSGESKDYFADGRMIWLKNRLAKLKSQPLKALDFGCGTGSATPFFFAHLGIDSLLGIDPSKKSIEKAREAWSHLPVKFTSNTQPSVGNFDLAFCNGVFHHIPLSERDTAIQSIFDELKPGSIFAFWENNPWNPVTRYAMSRVPFDKDAILVWPHQARCLLRTHGFTILNTDYVFFFPRALASLRKLEPILRWLPLGGQYLILCRKPFA